MKDSVRPSLNPITRNSRYFAGRAIDKFLGLGTFAFNNKSQIVESRVKNLAQEERLVVFHTLTEGEICRNVLEVIEEFSKASWKVCFVSNGKAKVDLLGDNVDYLIRNNKGFDFGGYRDALKIYNLGKFQRILLLNDSMYWYPTRLLDLASKEIENLDDSVWALTSSNQVSRHLQSFFYLFSSKNATFLHELSAVPNYPLKRMLVSQCEIGISRRLQRSGVNLHAFFEYEDLVRRALDLNHQNRVQDEVLVRLKKGIVLNPTQHLWELLMELSFPGVKKSLICKNPARLTRVPNVPS